MYEWVQHLASATNLSMVYSVSWGWCVTYRQHLMILLLLGGVLGMVRHLRLRESG